MPTFGPPTLTRKEKILCGEIVPEIETVSTPPLLTKPEETKEIAVKNPSEIRPSRVGTLEVHHPDPGVIIVSDRKKGELTSHLETRADNPSPSKTLPKIHCNNCMYTAKCQYWKPGYECAFQDEIQAISLQSARSIAGSMVDLTELEIQRAHQAVILERLTGNGVSKEASNAINNAFAKLQALRAEIDRETVKPTIMQRASPAVQNIQAFVNPTKQMSGEPQPSLLEHLVSILQSAPREKGGSVQ